MTRVPLCMSCASSVNCSAPWSSPWTNAFQNLASFTKASTNLPPHLTACMCTCKIQLGTSVTYSEYIPQICSVLASYLTVTHLLVCVCFGDLHECRKNLCALASLRNRAVHADSCTAAAEALCYALPFQQQGLEQGLVPGAQAAWCQCCTRKKGLLDSDPRMLLDIPIMPIFFVEDGAEDATKLLCKGIVLRTGVGSHHHIPSETGLMLSGSLQA